MVLRKTKNGNLILSPKQTEMGKTAGISKMQLFEGTERKAQIFDTIASIEKPLYLAKPSTEEEMDGKTLSSKMESKKKAAKKQKL